MNASRFVLEWSTYLDRSSVFFLIINRKTHGQQLKWPAKQPAIHTVSSQQSSFPGCVPPYLGANRGSKTKFRTRSTRYRNRDGEKGKEESSVCNSLIITPSKPSIKGGNLGRSTTHQPLISSRIVNKIVWIVGAPSCRVLSMFGSAIFWWWIVPVGVRHEHRDSGPWTETTSM